MMKTYRNVLGCNCITFILQSSHKQHSFVTKKLQHFDKEILSPITQNVSSCEEMVNPLRRNQIAIIKSTAVTHSDNLAKVDSNDNFI